MAETRDAYVERMKTKLDEWNAEITRLESKAGQAKAEVRLKYRKQIDDIQAKRDEVRKKIEELKQAGESAWEDLKTGAEIAWQALGDAVKDAKANFK